MTVKVLIICKYSNIHLISAEKFKQYNIYIIDAHRWEKSETTRNSHLSNIAAEKIGFSPKQTDITNRVDSLLQTCDLKLI